MRSALCKVWWYCSGLCFGRLAVHNVATSETKAIPASQQMPAVMVMAQVSSSHCFASICAQHLCQHCGATVTAGTFSPSLLTGGGVLLKAWEQSGWWLQDIHGDVWTGHKDGYVRIWSESSYNPVCPLFKAMHSDIRCAAI